MTDNEKYCPLGKRRRQIISLAKRRNEIFRSDSPVKKASEVDKDVIENTDSEPETLNVCKKPRPTFLASSSEGDENNPKMIKPSKKVQILSDIVIKKPFYGKTSSNTTSDQCASPPAHVATSTYTQSNLLESQTATKHLSPADQCTPSPRLTLAPVGTSPYSMCNLPESKKATEHLSPADQRAPPPPPVPVSVGTSTYALCNLPDSQTATEHLLPAVHCTPPPPPASASVEMSPYTLCNLSESKTATEHLSPADQCAPPPPLAPIPVGTSPYSMCNLPESQRATEHLLLASHCTPPPPPAPIPVGTSPYSMCNLPESKTATEHLLPAGHCTPPPPLAPIPVGTSPYSMCNLPESQTATEHLLPAGHCTPPPPPASASVEMSPYTLCNLSESKTATEHLSPADQCAPPPPLAPIPVGTSPYSMCNLPESKTATEHLLPAGHCTPPPPPASASVEMSPYTLCNLPEFKTATEHLSPADQCAPPPPLAPIPVGTSPYSMCNLPESKTATEHLLPAGHCTPPPPPASASVEMSPYTVCNLPESKTATEYLSNLIADQCASPPPLALTSVQISPSTLCNLPESQTTDHVTDGLTHITSDLKYTSSQKKRMRRTKLKKAFIDFISDTEEQDFSSGSSDIWNSNDESSSTDVSEKSNKRKKYTKKKLKNKKDNHPSVIEVKKKRINKTKLRKVLKDSGKAYETRDGILKTEKVMKENPCKAEKCPRKCYEITEERRRSLYDHFWNLDTLRRRDWILRCAQAIPIKRRKRSAIDNDRRQTTYEYTINQGEGHIQVCQKFLLNTLCISQKYLLYTIKNSHENMALCDRRTSNVVEKYSEMTKQYVRTYITNLPAMPSHYSRKRSNKTYLPQEFKNVTNLYRLYSEHCKGMRNKDDPDPKYEIVSERLFRQIFCEFNISFHVPKKDKCVQCTKNENDEKRVSNDDLENHLAEKMASYKRFKFHQNLRSQCNDTVVCSFDLQKVLNTPHGESMLLYYSRKYAVYNLTFYESVTQNVFCYTWGETDAKRGSNEIATSLTKYLETIDQRIIKNVILYCDSCSGQNKNKNVLAAINNFLRVSKHVEVVQMNFLLPGHTYMPVDSVHAVIEREVKRLIVWSPSQWATYFESARKQPRPYAVIALDHTDFLNFDDYAAELFTKTTLKNIKFKDIRIVTMKKKDTNKIFIKYSMLEHAECHDVKLRETYTKRKSKGKGKKTENLNETNKEDEKNISIKQLYNSKIPISEAKWKDLVSLCEKNIIPKRFHNEFLLLPRHSKVEDRLAETDEEDDEDNE